MARYTWDDKKPKDNKIIIEGVDLNDREAVEKKYKELKAEKSFLSVVLFLAAFVIGFVVFDFWNVNFNDEEPLIPFLTMKKEEKETSKTEIKTYKDVLHVSLLEYFEKKELIDNNFDSFEINSYTKDGVDEEKGYVDYYVDITYVCKDNGTSCFKVLKESVVPNKLLVYVTVDKANNVVDVYSFKEEGIKYDELVVNYTDKLKNYFII